MIVAHESYVAHRIVRTNTETYTNPQDSWKESSFYIIIQQPPNKNNIGIAGCVMKNGYFISIRIPSRSVRLQSLHLRNR